MPEQNPIRGELSLVHHHPGRLRLRARALIGAENGHPIIAAAQQAASATSGVRSFTWNRETGSMLIEYEPGAVDADELLRSLATACGASGVQQEEWGALQRDELIEIFLSAMSSVNRLMSEATSGRADLREAVPATLAFVSLVSFLRAPSGSRLPRWDSALWWSHSLFMQFHKGEIQRACQTDSAPAKPRSGA